MASETDELVDLVARAEAIHRGRFGSAADAVRKALDAKDRRIAELRKLLDVAAAWQDTYDYQDVAELPEDAALWHAISVARDALKGSTDG